MLFNTLPFAFFLALVLALHRLLPEKARRGLLLVASLVFYGVWLPAHLPLLVGSLVVNYALLVVIARGRFPRAALAASVVFTLGVLAWFKYAAFLVTSLSPLLETWAAPALPVPDVILPLGISFYSFQMIALAVDVARGQAEPPPGFARYALFISFFPQLIAGPILRGGEFLPQLAAGFVPDRSRSRRGVWLIACGLFKKMILADFLLAPLVDRIYLLPGTTTGPVTLLSAYAFSFQLYFDFSGYTDIARGIGKLLGYELPLNFRAPFLSRNPAEFWRRWHVTLSSWLRDYLYVPLGGNRGSEVRTCLNLLLTMILGGLWHGAGWSFVVWGGVCGVGLVAHRLFARQWGGHAAASGWRHVVAVSLSYHWFALTLILFRAPSLADGLAHLSSLGHGWSWADVPIAPFLVVMACMGLHVAEHRVSQGIERVEAWMGWGARGALIEGVVYGLLAALTFAAGSSGGSFIYFQF